MFTEKPIDFHNSASSSTSVDVSMRSASPVPSVQSLTPSFQEQTINERGRSLNTTCEVHQWSIFHVPHPANRHEIYGLAYGRLSMIEPRHITAVKKPCRRSSRYEALGWLSATVNIDLWRLEDISQIWHHHHSLHPQPWSNTRLRATSAWNGKCSAAAGGTALCGVSRTIWWLLYSGFQRDYKFQAIMTCKWVDL